MLTDANEFGVVTLNLSSALSSRGRRLRRNSSELLLIHIERIIGSNFRLTTSNFKLPISTSIGIMFKFLFLMGIYYPKY